MSLEVELRYRGFKIAKTPTADYSFDLVAAKDDEVLAIKFIEGFDKESIRKYADDLRRLAFSLDLVPLMVSKENLPEDSLVTYKGIPSLSQETFEKVVKGIETPFVYFSRGGVYVKIRGDRVRKYRRERRMSLGELSNKLGVTRRMIYEYEVGRSDATLEVACKLIEIFGDDVIDRLILKNIKEYFVAQSKEIEKDDVLLDKVTDPLLRRLLNKLIELGFINRIFEKAPFQLAATETSTKKRKILVKLGEDKEEEHTTIQVAKLCRSDVVLLGGNKLRFYGDNLTEIFSDNIKNENINIENIRKQKF
ncbi:MAG: helix-turn-helix domain-containing protein [Thermofilaceae archaeon]|nr:helix-turn-helix domain-containing protein [Thermofilaceae archaeon]MDW8003628.1 helix-turn-helix domain-containing protein [Thermofilaceae archaeon]